MKIKKSIFKQEDTNNTHLTVLQEVNQLINESDNFQETLDNIVNLVASRLKTDVCSIYLLNPTTNTLTLQATIGLNIAARGKIRLKLGEGVTSLVIEKMRPVSIDNVQQHPRFRKFKEADEDAFNSFLGLPITGNKKPIGVFVVQKKENYSFHGNEINMLQILTTQISGVIQVASVIEKTVHPSDESIVARAGDRKEIDKTIEKETGAETEIKKIYSFKGLPTSFGYGYGKALFLEEPYSFSIVTNTKIDNVEAELKTFKQAIDKSKQEIMDIKSSLEKQISSDTLKIFDSHIMLIDDKKLKDSVTSLIKEKNNAAYATFKIINTYIETFKNFADPYIKERSIDIEDIGQRIINNILGIDPMGAKDLPENCVIVSKFLTPSTTANLDVSKVNAIVTEHGGNTSHASILARSLEIPAVVISDIHSKISLGDNVLVDGNTGFVFINPLKPLIVEYEKKAELEVAEFHSYFLQYVNDTPKTKDGQAVNIGANIGVFSDIELSKKKRTKNVGLFRTEFLYMIRNQLPTLEEQRVIYKDVVNAFPDGEITIRTLDIGGDKLLPYLPMPKEDNPCLGYKSSRFLLDHPKILFDQIKAILMASAHGNVRILFPMISSLNELIQLNDFLEIAKGTLVYNKVAFNDKVGVGMMIEVPSVIFQIDEFIPYVDFFSIGTNDLIQYLLAVDRDNEKVSNLYNPLHPAVLRAIDIISQKVGAHKKRLSVCGEMAGTTETTFALLALGIRDLSSSPSSIPYLHYLVKQVNNSILQKARKAILAFSDTAEVEIYIRKTLRRIAPKLYL